MAALHGELVPALGGDVVAHAARAEAAHVLRAGPDHAQAGAEGQCTYDVCNFSYPLVLKNTK